MKKLLFYILILVYFPQNIVQGKINPMPKKIIVVGDRSYPPFEFLDSKGKPTGIFVDIWKLWAKKTNITVDYRLMVWENALEMVKKGKADVVGGIFFSKQRAKFFDFSKPYMKINTRIFYNKKIFGMESLDDAMGFEVGVVKDDFAETYVKLNYPDIKLKTYPTTEAMVRDAIKNNIKVFVCDTPVALFVLSKFKGGDNFRYSARPIYTSKVYSAVKKGNTILLKTISNGFSKITKKEIKGILHKWMGVSVHFLWIRHHRGY